MCSARSFWLLTTMAYVGGTGAGGRCPGMPGVGPLLALGLTAKPMLVTLPFHAAAAGFLAARALARRRDESRLARWLGAWVVEKVARCCC